MKILICWDDPSEAELISLYLNAGENEAAVATEIAATLELAKGGAWDVMLMTTVSPV